MKSSKKNKKEIEKGIEEVLREARQKNGWTYVEVVSRLKDDTLTGKEIKKWEIGLKYPDLDMIYKLSELYQIPSEELITAKSNSYEKGLASVNQTIIKWICYFFDISLRAASVITVIIYVAALIVAFGYFVDKASMFQRM